MNQHINMRVRNPIQFNNLGLECNAEWVSSHISIALELQMILLGILAHTVVFVLTPSSTIRSSPLIVQGYDVLQPNLYKNTETKSNIG